MTQADTEERGALILDVEQSVLRREAEVIRRWADYEIEKARYFKTLGREDVAHHHGARAGLLIAVERRLLSRSGDFPTKAHGNGYTRSRKFNSGARLSARIAAKRRKPASTQGGADK